MQSIIIAASTQYPLGGTDPSAGSLITFKTVGLTATCNVYPKIRKPGDGSSNLIAIPYYNVNTNAVIAAGTAITADGVYQISATGPEVILDATVSSGTATVYWWIVEGGSASAGFGAGSSGSGAGIVPVMVQDPTGTYTLPAGDAAGRSIFTTTQGQIADGVSATGVAPVLIGGYDAAGLAHNAPTILGSSTSTSTTQYGLATYSMLVGNSSANTLRILATGSNISDGGNGANALVCARLNWNGASWDRVLGNISAGTVNRPYALPANDWNYVGASGGITNTTPVALKAAAGGSLRAYLTSIQLANESATATEVEIRDNATAVWRGYVPANQAPFSINFPTPPKTTANTALNFVCLTTASAVLVNAQGYTAL